MKAEKLRGADEEEDGPDRSLTEDGERRIDSGEVRGDESRLAIDGEGDRGTEMDLGNENDRGDDEDPEIDEGDREIEGDEIRGTEIDLGDEIDRGVDDDRENDGRRLEDREIDGVDDRENDGREIDDREDPENDGRDDRLGLLLREPNDRGAEDRLPEDRLMDEPEDRPRGAASVQPTLAKNMNATASTSGRIPRGD